MGVDRLNEQQDDQERLGILDWLTPITTSRYNYFFQTPEMTSFKYKPIGLEGPAFRLLQLLKGNDDPIQGRLFESKLSPLEYVRDYAALSYTWGNEFRPCEIMINESKMAVTKNAYLALRDLRYKEKDRILWIDALCP
jgi:Heterokaryon incompatibility protein (HET)